MFPSEYSAKPLEIEIRRTFKRTIHGYIYTRDRKKRLPASRWAWNENFKTRKRKRTRDAEFERACTTPTGWKMYP